ncbi:MAG: Hsp20/alpha crystallin family protein [Thermodesulfobacteriota bacterium]|nr:Hsp20/alpha crystallin family protein [Thermodesulfobacteriota bacterium]
MTEAEAKALEAREKREVASAAEQTRPGLTFKPAVDIFETQTGITLLADMPGVKAGDLNIDLREDVITLSGEVERPETAGETEILKEYRTGRYVRQFSLSDTIDQAKIEAELQDGVLRLVLPKAEKAVPRKIAVKAK